MSTKSQGNELPRRQHSESESMQEAKTRDRDELMKLCRERGYRPFGFRGKRCLTWPPRGLAGEDLIFGELTFLPFVIFEEPPFGDFPGPGRDLHWGRFNPGEARLARFYCERLEKVKRGEKTPFEYKKDLKEWALKNFGLSASQLTRVLTDSGIWVTGKKGKPGAGLPETLENLGAFSKAALLMLEGIPEDETPELYTRSGLDPADLFLVPPPEAS